MVDVGKLDGPDDYRWFIDMAEPVMGMQLWEHKKDGWFALPGPVTLLVELLYPVTPRGTRFPGSNWIDSRARHAVPTRTGEWYPESPSSVDQVVLLPFGDYPEDYDLIGYEVGHKKINVDD